MYGCESWTIKKAECQRIDDFELWCRRLFKVPWTARRSNQSILKEISPECLLEGLKLKLKLQYCGHLMRRTGSFEKTLIRLKEGEGDNREWDCLMASPTQCTCVWANSRRYWRTGKSGVLQSMGLQRVDMPEQLNSKLLQTKTMLFTYNSSQAGANTSKIAPGYCQFYFVIFVSLTSD